MRIISRWHSYSAKKTKDSISTQLFRLLSREDEEDAGALKLASDMQRTAPFADASDGLQPHIF